MRVQIISLFVFQFSALFITTAIRLMKSSRYPKHRKGVTYGENGEMTSCIFCNIIDRNAPANIIYEDEHFVCFTDISPVTSYHNLVIPRKHIDNISDLAGASHAQLVRDMVNIGKKCLFRKSLTDKNVSYKDLNEKEKHILNTAQFSFHVPPWNSINHLHLHCIGQPDQMGWLERLKHWESSSVWSVSAEHVINIVAARPPRDSSQTPGESSNTPPSSTPPTIQSHL
mmetsp:Transcript_40230/g.41033  ORF Transcript_40230/g.41033 Transcript_40230/m.41033 type:complete len:227 (-) Transcript_40230:2-682(-)